MIFVEIKNHSEEDVKMKTRIMRRKKNEENNVRKKNVRKMVKKKEEKYMLEIADEQFSEIVVDDVEINE